VTTFTLQSTSTTDEIIYWKADDTAGTTAIYYKVSESKWYDGSSGGQPTAFSINDGTPSDPSAVVSEGDSVKLTAGSSGNYGSFTMFSTSSSSTPTTPPDTLPNVAGTTQTYEYKYRSSDVNYYYYDRWTINSGEWANAEMIWGINNKSNAIKVGKTQGHSDYNTWLDAEAASTNYMPPHTVSENGANIELKDTNSLVFYAFVNPYYEAPTSFSTPITPIGVSGGWAGYSWVYDSVGTDSHNDYWFYVLDDPNTSAYPDLSNELKFYYNDPDGNRYSNGGQVDSTVTFYGHSSITDPYFGKVYEAPPSLNWWEDGYGALPVITGTGALNGQSFSFYSENSTHIEFIISGTESNPSTIKFTKADGSWIDGTSGDWPSQVNYDSTNVILRTNTWSNEFVNPNTSSPYTA
jgi:hypothetical protein